MSKEQQRCYEGCFLFESWYASKRLAEAAIYVGADKTVMVKTIKRGLCKDTIKNLEKYCPGGSYLVFNIKSTVPRDRPIISIGYKYKYWKVLYFIGKEEASKKGWYYIFI